MRITSRSVLAGLLSAALPAIAVADPPAPVAPQVLREPAALAPAPASPDYVRVAVVPQPPVDPKEVGQLRSRIAEQTGLLDVSAESIRTVISKLQEQREQLQLDAAGAGGRRTGLEEAVKKLSLQLESRLRSDAVIGEISHVVEARQKQLERLQTLFNSGAASSSDVSDAEAKLAEARADSAAARQKAFGGTEELDAWNRQLLELDVADAERRARLDYIEKRLDKMNAALADVDHLQALQSQLDTRGVFLYSGDLKATAVGNGRSVIILSQPPSTAPTTRP